MAIANELSSEIATALLTAKDRSPTELTDLKNILLEVHSALLEMTQNARRHRRTTQPVAKSATSQG